MQNKQQSTPQHSWQKMPCKWRSLRWRLTACELAQHHNALSQLPSGLPCGCDAIASPANASSPLLIAAYSLLSPAAADPMPYPNSESPIILNNGDSPGCHRYHPLSPLRVISIPFVICFNLLAQIGRFIICLTAKMVNIGYSLSQTHR